MMYKNIHMLLISSVFSHFRLYAYKWNRKHSVQGPQPENKTRV